MIHDLAKFHGGALPDYDLCIVGSGPAGGTMAAELAESGLRIAVVESGRDQPTRLGDSLRAVRSEGLRIKANSRERVLGGASTTWAGLSSPLDAIDLAPRPWAGLPGWPIPRDALLPYWRQAAERYRFAPLERYGTGEPPGEDGGRSDPPGGFAALKRKGDLSLDWRDLDEKIFLAAADPQDFGRELRHVYESAPQGGGAVDLWLDATVVRLEAGASGRGSESDPATVESMRSLSGNRIRFAVLRASNGRTARLAARVFVLAAGGIENARLLLLSRDLFPQGLGNECDQVGRHLMNHLKGYHGTIRLRAPLRELPYHFGCLYEGYAGYAGLRLREELQAERGLLNSYVRFEPLYPWSDSPGVEALVLLVKRSRGLLRRWQDSRRDEVVSLRDWSETGDDAMLGDVRPSSVGTWRLAGRLAAHVPSTARYVAARLREGRAPRVRRIRLRSFMEMEPHPSNRVTLGDETDPYRLPVPVVRMNPTALDRRSIAAVHEALAAEVRRLGLGELEGALRADEDPWPIDQDASHHLGTTRMGMDPSTSVVDPTCRLHGAANVYVAGGSVFPTSGCANPTFTIVALSIRLAEQLRDVVLRRGAHRRDGILRTGGGASGGAGDGEKGEMP